MSSPPNLPAERAGICTRRSSQAVVPPGSKLEPYRVAAILNLRCSRRAPRLSLWDIEAFRHSNSGCQGRRERLFRSASSRALGRIEIDVVSGPVPLGCQIAHVFGGLAPE